MEESKNSIMEINKQKLRQKLETHLGRKPSSAELINAQKDVNLTIEVLFDEVQDMKARLSRLEKKSNI